MHRHPKPATAAPASKTYPRKLCKNCPKYFYQTKPTRQFCSSKCRMQFHQFGSSFGKLKETVEKMIGKEAAAIIAVEFGRYVAGKDFKRALAAAGFIHKSQLIKYPKTHRPKALHASLELLAGSIQNLNHRVTSIEHSNGSGGSYVAFDQKALNKPISLTHSDQPGRPMLTGPDRG